MATTGGNGDGGNGGVVVGFGIANGGNGGNNDRNQTLNPACWNGGNGGFAEDGGVANGGNGGNGNAANGLCGANGGSGGFVLGGW